MTGTGRSSRWAVALALGFAGLIGASAATAPASPARTAPSAFELTLEGTLTTVDRDDWWEPSSRGTFRSRPPFCATGTFVDDRVEPLVQRRLVCDDGTGSLVVSFLRWFERNAPVDARWKILEGSGSYASLRGGGSLWGEGDAIDPSPGVTVTWRSTFAGVVDRDAVGPSVAIASAHAARLRHPAGAYAIRLALALRDDVEGNPVSYTLRVSTAGGTELAQRLGTARTATVPLTLRINPRSARTTAVWLHLDAVDPVGNASWVVRRLKLPR